MGGCWSAIACARPWPRRLARRLDRDQTNAFRWVHGEGDGLRESTSILYDQVAVVRFDGAGARSLLPAISMTCWRVLRPRCACHASSIRERADGNLGEIEVSAKMGIRFIVTWAGPEGRAVLLDQRENRQAVAGHAAGSRC